MAASDPVPLSCPVPSPVFCRLFLCTPASCICIDNGHKSSTKLSCHICLVSISCKPWKGIYLEGETKQSILQNIFFKFLNFWIFESPTRADIENLRNTHSKLCPRLAGTCRVSENEYPTGTDTYFSSTDELEIKFDTCFATRGGRLGGKLESKFGGNQIG